MHITKCNSDQYFGVLAIIINDLFRKLEFAIGAINTIVCNNSYRDYINLFPKRKLIKIQQNKHEN